MDFDKDENILDVNYNKFQNCVSQMEWIQKEIKLHEVIISETEEQLFFVYIYRYLNQRKIDEYYALDAKLNAEFKVLNP